MKRNKRFLSLVLVAALLVALVPWSSKTASAAYGGVLEFDANGKFTVMQVADIQSKKAPSEVVNAIANSINRYHPDLVVFTGDNVIESVGSNFQTAVNTFLAPLLSTNTKFAVTFGNHDDEGSGTPNKTVQYDYYKSKGGSNFIDHDVLALDGVGNGAIPIYANGQTSGTPAYNVYVMDSGSNPSSGSYDACYTSQVDYYIQNSLANPAVPSIWFQHVIVPDIYTRCMTTTNNGTTGYIGKGSPFSTSKYYIDTARINLERTYLNSIAASYKEGPCPANQSVYEAAAHRSSSTYGSKTLYEAWRDYGDFKGAYFGHDHENKFTCTTSDGIDLGYGKGTTLYKTLGIIPYNDGDPGCSIYQLDIDGSYTTEYSANTDLADRVLVAYDANGGLGTVQEKLFAKNASVTLTPNAFAKTGSTFSGWNTAADGSGTSRADGATFNVGTTDIMLYAQWGAPVNITFDANGGSGGTGPIEMTPGGTLTAPVVAKLGHNFTGWSPPVPSAVPAVDTTYTAQWAPVYVDITFYANGGSGTTGPMAMVPGEPLTAPVVERTGHTFTNWAPGVPTTVPANNVMYVAQWSVNSYTITFDSNGGTGGTENSLQYGSALTAPNVERTGYTFTGWSSSVPETVPAAHTTYTAQWALTYTLGDINADSSITASDALMTLKSVSGSIAFSDLEKLAADVNRDGSVTASDALMILKFVSGSITSF